VIIREEKEQFSRINIQYSSESARNFKSQTKKYARYNMQYPIESARSSKEVTIFFGKSIYKSRKLIYNFEVLRNLTKGEIL